MQLFFTHPAHQNEGDNKPPETGTPFPNPKKSCIKEINGEITTATFWPEATKGGSWKQRDLPAPVPKDSNLGRGELRGWQKSFFFELA